MVSYLMYDIWKIMCHNSVYILSWKNTHTLQAATFNYDIVHQVTKATSDEVRAKNNDAVSKGVHDFHTGLSCW